MMQWKEQHEGSKCPLVLEHETQGARLGGDKMPRAAGEGSSRAAAVAWGFSVGLLGGSYHWPCAELLSFPQSLQSDKEALQEGRGAVVKYRRTPDGYIQIGTAGCGVVNCLLGLMPQPVSSPSSESRPLVLLA